MDWTDALKVGAVIIGSLGGGGAIVFGFSGFLGQVWMQRLKGDIDARLQRLDAALSHQNYLLQKFAELELAAIAECWPAARVCVPLINSTRPINSGTDEAVLAANAQRLADAHNALIEITNRHEPFLQAPIAQTLEAIGRVVRLELSNIQYHEHFKGDWWEKGEKNQQDLKTLTDGLLVLVKARIIQLRAEATP